MSLNLLEQIYSNLCSRCLKRDPHLLDGLGSQFLCEGREPDPGLTGHGMLLKLDYDPQIGHQETRIA